MSEKFTTPSGETVTLRGLTGFEVMVSRKRPDEVAQNAFVLGCAMDADEASGLAWMKSHLAGDFTAVMAEVQSLSGLSADAAKEADKSLSG